MSKPSETSQLAARLKEAIAIKSKMTDLLRDLETKATGQPIERLGGWRHHPTDWDEQYLPKNPT